jgi:hypothetical protein
MQLALYSGQGPRGPSPALGRLNSAGRNDTDYPTSRGIADEYPFVLAAVPRSRARRDGQAPPGGGGFATSPYCCGAGFSTLNTAPCGSVKTADRPTDGMSNGSTVICPPPAVAWAAVASASSTAK